MICHIIFHINLLNCICVAIQNKSKFSCWIWCLICYYKILVLFSSIPHGLRISATPSSSSTKYGPIIVREAAHTQWCHASAVYSGLNHSNNKNFVYSQYHKIWSVLNLIIKVCIEIIFICGLFWRRSQMTVQNFFLSNQILRLNFSHNFEFLKVKMEILIQYSLEWMIGKLQSYTVH